MRRILFTLAAMLASVAFNPSVSAQVPTRPTIHNVTLDERSGVLSITGVGFGQDPVVTVDGQPVSVRQGGSETRLEVLAPAALLITPGSYRLTVVDPLRHVGDTFVVASQSMTIAPGGVNPADTRGAEPEAAPVATAPSVVSAPATVRQAGSAPSPLTVIEDSGMPWRTAVGFQALLSNTAGGQFNTATGYRALFANTTGSFNTASGYLALQTNSTGGDNTASGTAALSSNTSGFNNTGSGSNALRSNTTGFYNTASGGGALEFNTTGTYNTASGTFALVSNGTGYDNTATGANALYTNTTGTQNTASGRSALEHNQTSYNTASGAYALYTNTTGAENTADGHSSLFLNTTGFSNTASGVNALFFNTTGSYNSASGWGALFLNTVGWYNAASGSRALYSNTEGFNNTASGQEALYANTTGGNNTAIGHSALQSSTTGSENVAVSNAAGFNATTGSYNVFVGAEVQGTAADTNTIRIGLPYSGGGGQNKTFVAGISNTALDASNGVQIVWVDKNGQLGTLMQPASASGAASIAQADTSRQPQAMVPQVSPDAIEQLTRTVQAQQATINRQQAVNAELRERLARLEALLAPAAGRSGAR